MTSFGSQLRSARIEKEWSIEYVSFKSKIQPVIIENLEEDEYSQFSSASYVKSFLRKYSNFLELDLEEEINELEIIGYASAEAFTSTGVKENLEMTQFSKKNQRYRRAEKGKGSPVFLVGSVVVLLSALAGFYYMGSQANAPEAGARDIVHQFENREGAFSRNGEAKETPAPSEKSPMSPIMASPAVNPPLASTRGAHRSMPDPLTQFNPSEGLDTIEKPDVRTFKFPELESVPTSSRPQPEVKPREINPLFDY